MLRSDKGQAVGRPPDDDLGRSSGWAKHVKTEGRSRDIPKREYLVRWLDSRELLAARYLTILLYQDFLIGTISMSI